jgi:hypothetical protein
MQITVEAAGSFAIGRPPDAMGLTDVSRHRLGNSTLSRLTYSKTHAL